MGFGFSILLLAVGAILAFAVHATTYLGVDVHVVGWILMAAGLLGLVWSLILTSARRRTVVVEPRNEAMTRVVERDPMPVQREVPQVVQRDVSQEDAVRRDSL
jgi:hypothetical protein